MSLCRDCGAELDDFGPCSCAFGPESKASSEIRKASSASAREPFRARMRDMVARKLAKQRSET